MLVCPELREQAVTLLPEIDPAELFVVEPKAARIQEPPRLALVEPERRAPLAVALAVYLTEALLLGALRGTAVTAVIFAASFALSW